MVQVSINVRPTQGYHYPSKVDHIEMNAFERLEAIQEKFQTTGSTTRLYYGRHELPLNSSIGSHNFDDGAILECCRSPEMSAALSSCLKDMDRIKKLPVRERTRENLMEIIQTPTAITYEYDHEMWSSWTDEKLKNRMINLAIIKSVLQRKDRYHVHDLPKVDDCTSLYEALKEHKVWEGGGQEKRSSFKSQSYLFNPVKKDGNPSTNFILVGEKLRIQKEIRSGFHTRLQFTAGYDSPPEDWLEEFVRQDHARHGTAGDISRSNNTEDPCAAYLAPSPPRRRNTSPSRSHQNSGNDTPSRGTTSSRSRVYIPQYSSGPFSVLATLHLSMHSNHRLSRGRRLLTLTENELKQRAQPMCRSNLYDKGRIRGRNAFQCMDGLVEKQLVRKEIVRNTEISGEIEKWGLLPEGELLGRYCSDFHRAVDHIVKRVNEGKYGKSNTNLALCLDTREDVHLLERMKMCCEDENVPFTEKELPAGDYLFLEQSGGQDYVLPLVIERKSWSDLADSCLGKGRAMNRLDCVSLGTNIVCAGNCQICKMKRSGCTQIMFIIEGERCLARDGTHRSVKKCSFDNCCSACKQLTERHGHGITQDVLEGVLHRIQVEHGCLIHYTKSYNETIQSLFDMRILLQSEPKCLKGKTQSYESYASNSRSRSANNVGQLPPRPTSVQELNIEEMLALVGDVWNVDTVRQSLGLGTSSRFLSRCQSKQPRKKTSGNGNAGDITELDGASDPVCIDLESARREGSTKASMSSAKKRRKTDNHEAICLDLDSDVEEIEPIRGGGDPFDLSTDDDEIEVVAPASNNKRGNSTTSSRKQGKQKHRSVSSSASKRLQHDICLLSSDDESSSQVQQSMSRKRKASEVVANGADKSNPLLILQGWHDYEVKFHKGLENIWKEVYLSATDNGHMGDFYSTAVARLNDKMRESTYPFVRRRTLMRFTLWMQLVMQVQIRAVLRTRFSDEIKVRLGQKVATGSENISHLMQSSSPARALEYAASHSTPNHQSVAATMSANRKRPPSTNNRESDFVREARLRRFESASGSRQCPPATSSSSVDRSNRKRSPTSWSCPKCTLENKLDDTSCSACGGISPMKVTSDFGDWSCSVCTLLNNASNTNCSACSSSKVPTAASASLHPNNAHLARPASSSYTDNVSSSYSPMGGPTTTQSQSKVKRTVRCGACGNEGHNRSTATEHNCPAYFDDKEIDMREKKRLKREKEIEKEKEAIEAMQRQNETSDRMQAELRKQIEALERDKKLAEDFRKEELKRRKKKVERLQKRQNK